MGDRTGAALVELLDTFTYTSARAVRQRVIEQAAATYLADIAALVDPDGADITIPDITTPGITVDQLVELARGWATTHPDTVTAVARLEPLGQVHVACLPPDDGTGRLLLVRNAGPFTADEVEGCRAMVRLMGVAVRTIATLDAQIQVNRELAAELDRSRAQADEVLRRHTEFTTRMLDIQGLLSVSRGPVLTSIVAQAQALVPGEVIALQLLRSDGMLELAQLSADAPPAYRHALQLVEPGQGLAGLAMERNEVVIADVYARHPWALPELAEAGLTAVISAPIRRRHEVVGALTVSSRTPDRHFGRDEIETVLLLAGYASVALTDALTLDQRQRALEEAEWQATHDPLTGLANRRLVIDIINERLAAGTDLNVLYIDVDRFKSVNDRYGHHVGDLVIKEVASRINAATRSDDLVGRLAGDEFIVVFGDEVDGPQATKIAERLRSRLNGPAVIAGRTVPLSASIGIATADGAATADDVINAADVAMYEAKSRGRNQVGRYERGLQSRLRHEAELSERLEMTALSGTGLHLVYQPIVEIGTAAVVGHEVLLRWVDPVLGQIPPDVFIPLAESLGVVTAIDDWVLATALSEVMTAGNRARLSVNVSPPWLARPGVADRVSEVADETGFPLDQLTLEVTERVALADGVTAILRELRALGVRIMLDDFGTGYSSLAYVRTLEIDGIKIDRGFLQGVETDRHTAAILEAVMTLTDRLGASAIAEGVETAVQAGLLADFGCRLAQGYYYGRPQPAPGGLLPLGYRIPSPAAAPD